MGASIVAFRNPGLFQFSDFDEASRDIPVQELVPTIPIEKLNVRGRVGVTGLMNSGSIPCCSAQSAKVIEMNSGGVIHRSLASSPRRAMRRL
jgi:hypothetical protein